MAVIYLFIPVGLFIVWLFAKDLELPSGIKEDGISRAFLKISLFLYTKLFKKKRPLESEEIRGYLSVLNNRKDIEQMETEYFIRKISIFLVMVVAGCFLSLMMTIASAGDTRLDEERTIYRNEYGEGDFDLGLLATDGEGKELGEYELTVMERTYTDKEISGLFDRASAEMEMLILGDNSTLDEVREDLNLVESLDPYPFQISWRIDDYELMHFDGKLEKEKIPKEGAVVNLTATYKYGELAFQQSFTAHLMQKSLSPAERIEKEIGELIKGADQSSAYEREVTLPDEYDGKPIIWKEKTEDNSLLILILTLIGGCACYVFKDKELKKTMQERSKQMLNDYPQLISRLVLYLGAGMTVRNIFEKLSRNYLKGLERGLEKRFIYEELLRATRELASGVSETEVYERFGIRCGGQQYTRLATLLSQNLRKGNSELLNVLSQESKKAFSERMDNVRKMGEEAGTKLLLPMILMLVIVMIVIMIPAYMAF